MKINDIEVTGDSIVRAIKANYPKGKINLDAIEKNKLYNYVFLFGVRVATCNTSVPDDAIGGIRLQKGIMGYDYWETIYSEATTDPSPYWLINPMSDAAAYGGTAWVIEGQWNYSLGGNFKGNPCFRPKEKISVYRWRPTKQQIADSKINNTPLSLQFELAKKAGQVKIGTSIDTLIHRSWSPKNLYKDSAGCQVFANNGALNTLYSWAKKHYSIFKTNNFVYTLLTKEQFSEANNLKDYPTLSVIERIYQNQKITF
jgi:hypothetical protein